MSTSGKKYIECPVFMYHSISNNGSLRSEFVVSPQAFEAHLSYFKSRGFTTPRLDDLLRSPRKSVERPMLLTFDDGYEDNFVNAYPLLEKYGFTAIIAVVSDFSERTNRWDKRAGYPEMKLLSTDQIREMHQAGYTFASHTVSHSSLPSLNDVDLERELTVSKKAIEKVVGSAISSIVFPYGHVNERVKLAAGKAGYSAGFAVNSGPYFLHEDTLEIRRTILTDIANPLYLALKTWGVDRRARHLAAKMRELL